MPVARPERHDARVIAHVDLDCFYVQVEQRKKPELRGKPTAVVQYNAWKGGGLIAVGYEARAFGVKRSMRGDEAKEACPDIHLIQVPVARGKADLTLYRDAGSEVVSVLAKKGTCERASIDEVYLDITDAANKLLLEEPLQCVDGILDEVLGTHILGICKDAENKKEIVHSWLFGSDADHKDRLLACGAIIIAELRLEVLSRTQFTCSAGIAHNKMLAKLASGMNKPAQQTLVPSSYVPTLLSTLPVKKMKQLGGKLGSSLENDLGIKMVGDLLQFSETKLQELYGVNTGTWLWNTARGISGEEVKGRLLPKSHGCGKTFPGPQALRTFAAVEHWLSELSEELNDRIQADLEKNKRIAHQLTLHAHAYQERHNDSKKFPSKSCPLRYGKEKILQDSLVLFERGLREYFGSHNAGKRQHKQNNTWAISGLSITASNIFSTPSGVNPITSFFTQTSNVTGSSANLPADSRSKIETSVENMHEDREKCLAGIEANQLTDLNEDAVCMDSFTEDQHKSPTSTVEFVNGRNPELIPDPRKLLPFQSSCPQSVSNGSAGFSVDTIDQVRENSFFSYQDEMDGTQDIPDSENRTRMSPFLSKVKNSCGATVANLARKVDKTVGNSKLEDFWRSPRKVLSAESSSQRKNADLWSYNPDDIDESVVQELPEEIQQEVRHSLRHKRFRTAKNPTIGDYFKSK